MRCGFHLLCIRISNHPIDLPSLGSIHLRPSSTSWRWCFGALFASDTASPPQPLSCFCTWAFGSRSFPLVPAPTHDRSPAAGPSCSRLSFGAFVISFWGTPTFVFSFQSSPYRCFPAPQTSRHWVQIGPSSKTSSWIWNRLQPTTSRHSRGHCRSARRLGTGSLALWICLVSGVHRQQITHLEHHTLFFECSSHSYQGLAASSLHSVE